MRLNIWTSSAGARPDVSQYASEQSQALAAHFDVARISENEAGAAPSADLDLYHLADSTAYGFVLRAALARRGVVVLHDWNLQTPVISETVDRGDADSYITEMRRAHGEPGAFVARQVARGLGGNVLPSLYPLNPRILETSLAVVTLTAEDAERVARGFHDLPALAAPGGSVPSLPGFLKHVVDDRLRLSRAAAMRRPPEGSLNALLLDEAAAAAHDMGLSGLSLGLEPLLPQP